VKAVVVSRPGGPEVLEIREVPDPSSRAGWALIRVRAFGINRSEVVTRATDSGHGVTFPRVLGIECAGEVIDAPDCEGLQPGQSVVALMGQMGKEIDGSYAELLSVPATSVIPITTSLDWSELAAIPESYGTAWGSVVNTLGLRKGQSILIRGATSSVGMAALSIARSLGATVVATTRDKKKEPSLLGAGADVVLIDGGSIATAVREALPDGATVALELVGPVTTIDSSRALAERGVVCVTGFLGNSWDFDQLTGKLGPVRLARFRSGVITRATYGSTLQRIVEGVEEGAYRPNIAGVFQLEEIAEAHRTMESNAVCGKLVAVVP
jgi:NADPH:quinone reductase-like Zn-dependent oxidoreductase